MFYIKRDIFTSKNFWHMCLNFKYVVELKLSRQSRDRRKDRVKEEENHSCCLKCECIVIWSSVWNVTSKPPNDIQIFSRKLKTFPWDFFSLPRDGLWLPYQMGIPLSIPWNVISNHILLSMECHVIWRRCIKHADVYGVVGWIADGSTPRVQYITYKTIHSLQIHGSNASSFQCCNNLFMSLSSTQDW